MGKIAEALRSVTVMVFKDTVARDSFESGQKGWPPKRWNTPELQEIADKAYEQGQKSVLVKIGNKIAKD